MPPVAGRRTIVDPTTAERTLLAALSAPADDHMHLPRIGDNASVPGNQPPPTPTTTVDVHDEPHSAPLGSLGPLPPQSFVTRLPIEMSLGRQNDKSINDKQRPRQGQEPVSTRTIVTWALTRRQ